MTQRAVEVEAHRLGHLDEQLARAQDEPGIRVADPGGELAERPRHAGVRVRAEEHLARPHVAFLGQRRVADPGEPPAVLALELSARGVELPVALGVVDHVVEVGQPLLAHEVAQDVHVAVGQAVGGENVVVGDDDDLFAVPDLGVAAEFAVEHADGPRAADIVSQENIGVDPDIVPGRDPGAPAGTGENGFGKRHREGRQYATGAKTPQGTVPAPHETLAAKPAWKAASGPAA